MDTTKKTFKERIISIKHRVNAFIYKVFIKINKVFIKIKKILFIFNCKVWSLFGYISLYGFWGIGDTCYELTYLDEFKKQTRKKIRVIAYKKKTNVFKYYESIDKISKIGLKKALRLIKWSDIKKKNMIFIGHFAYEGELPEKMKTAYNLTDDYQLITYPKVKPIETDIKENSIFINFSSVYYHSETIQAFLSKTIDIATSKGLFVYANSPLPENYKNNPSVKEVFWDLEYLYNAVQKVKSVVSIRTGLLDFIINSGTKIICLYDKSNDGKFLYDSFNLNNWKKNINKINQFFVEDVSPEEIFPMID